MIRKRLLLFVGILVLSACNPTRSSPSPELSPSGTVSLTQTVEAPPTLRPTQTPEPTARHSADYGFVSKSNGESIRVMTYNINWDSIFPADDPKNHSYREFSQDDKFYRLMRALKPDVLCLQEIHHIRTHEELGAFLAEALDDHRRWQVVNVRDTVIATHFDLIEDGFEVYTRGIRPSMAQAAALVDLPEERFGHADLYVICAHFKADGGIGDIRERGRQADVIMRQVRDFKSPGDKLDLPNNTPYIILGDLNVYDTDPALHLQTLLTGDIQFEQDYGSDVIPDWDGSSLADVLPSHNGLESEFYTWRADSSPFNPGALDRILFTDSVLQVSNAFVLNTTLLTDEALEALGLQRDDVVLDASTGYYDHLPIVVDFVIPENP